MEMKGDSGIKGKRAFGADADFNAAGVDFDVATGRYAVDVPIDLDMDVTMCSARLNALLEDKSVFAPKAETQLLKSLLS